jgi:hypothetical protein
LGRRGLGMHFTTPVAAQDILKDILKKLQIEPVITHDQNYRTNWRNHVRRMERVIIPKQLTTYAPRGRRCLRRPNKRWHETVTGHLA